MLQDARRAGARDATGEEAGATGWRPSRRLLRAIASPIAGALLILASAVSAPSQPAPGQPPPPPAGDDGQPQEVVHNENGFTIHANNADLPRLLTAVGSEAGFSVVDSGHNHQPLNVWITDAPLDVTLRRLLREANYILVYREGKRSTEIEGDGIEQVILLTSAGQGAAPPGNASPLAGPQSGGHPPVPGAPVPGAPPAPMPGAIPPGGVPPGMMPPPAVAAAPPGAPGQPQMPAPRRLRANQAQAQIQPGDLEALGIDPNMAAAGAVAAGGRRGMFQPPGSMPGTDSDDGDTGDEE